MDSDLDPFGDLLPEPARNQARIGGKFQPRAKPPPSKVIPINAQEKSVYLCSSALLGNEGRLANNGENMTDKPKNSSTQLVSSDALPSEVVVSNNNNGDSSLMRTVADSLQPDLDSVAGVVPDASVSKDTRSKEPVSSYSTTFSAAREPGKDNDSLYLHEKTRLEEVSLLSARIKDLDSVDAINRGTATPNGKGVWSSSLMKSTEDVGSFGLELDPFTDTVSAPAIGNARAGGKFKPRAKAQPRKGISEAIAVPISCTTVEEPASLASTTSANPESSELVDVGVGLNDLVNSSVTTLENLISEEPLKNEEYKNSGVTLPSVPHSVLGKPIGESADIFLGLEYIHDFVSQSPSTVEIPAPDSNDEEAARCKNSFIDPVTCNESVLQADDGRQESECQEPGSFPNMERREFLSEFTIASESCTRIFQPKPKIQISKEKPIVGNLSHDTDGFVAPPMNAQFIPSETVYDNEGSVAAFSSDEVLEYSSMSFNNFIPQISTSEFLVNREQINLTEAPRPSDASVSHQDVSGAPAEASSKSIKRNPSSASNPTQMSNSNSLAGERNEGDKSSRHLRKRTAGLHLVDEPEDEAHDNSRFPSEAPSTCIADEDDDYVYEEDEDDDYEDRADITSRKTGASKNSKKPAAEKDNPVRRRKRDNDAQEHSTQVPRKKFSHSTRRKNRLKNLLSMPEEEIDFQRLPIKDIILLAGYKEQLAVKEAKASKNASTNQSTANSIRGDESLNEEDTVASQQDGGYAEDQSNSLFNYHSFMDKTPTARWSKQDTELFYEGIRQFGTDLSMIQQLFPGRTRHQLKLKYKKEERQHPLRLSEALSSRAKDHSYYEKVIEQLQQVAAKAEQEANRDDSVSVADEEAELNPETNEEIAKCERDEDKTVEDDEGDIGGVHSPKYDEDEDEDDMAAWSSYQSYQY